MAVTVVKKIEDFLALLDKMKENVSLLVAYGKGSGEPILISPGSGYQLGESGTAPVPVVALKQMLEGKEFVEMKTTTIFRAFKNPECQQILLPNGDYVCVRIS